MNIPDTHKRQHRLECLNVVDAGTSIAVDFRLHTDFNAQSVAEALVSVFRQHGLPQSITLDRDVRFVGSWTARDFPSACLRLLACLGVKAIICPPRTPQHKPFVERYNGTYERECLQVCRPTDLAQAQAVTEWFVRHYNGGDPTKPGRVRIVHLGWPFRCCPRCVHCLTLSTPMLGYSVWRVEPTSGVLTTTVLFYEFVEWESLHSS